MHYIGDWVLAVWGCLISGWMILVYVLCFPKPRETVLIVIRIGQVLPYAHEKLFGNHIFRLVVWRLSCSLINGIPVPY